MLKNEAYIGKMYQFRKYRIEPRFRLKPSAKSKKTSTELRAREEWMLVTVPSLIPVELFEAVQRKLKTDADLSKRNKKRQYLLSGLLYCSKCDGRMGGHTIQGVL
jgi:site-specific DNA recombinase